MDQENLNVYYVCKYMMYKRSVITSVGAEVTNQSVVRVECRLLCGLGLRQAYKEYPWLFVNIDAVCVPTLP